MESPLAASPSSQQITTTPTLRPPLTLRQHELASPHTTFARQGTFPCTRWYNAPARALSLYPARWPPAPDAPVTLQRYARILDAILPPHLAPAKAPARNHRSRMGTPLSFAPFAGYLC